MLRSKSRFKLTLLARASYDRLHFLNEKKRSDLHVTYYAIFAVGVNSRKVGWKLWDWFVEIVALFLKKLNGFHYSISNTSAKHLNLFFQTTPCHDLHWIV